MAVPDFVTELSNESWMPGRVFQTPDVCGFLDHFIDADGSMQAHGAFKSICNAEFQNAYFGPLMTTSVGSPEELIFEGESHRHAENLEVKHPAYVASGDWHLS